MTLKNVTLDDKYDLTQNRVFVTGYQALIRACLMQQERDRRAGLNTAGYVSGYRGLPSAGSTSSSCAPRRISSGRTCCSTAA